MLQIRCEILLTFSLPVFCDEMIGRQTNLEALNEGVAPDRPRAATNHAWLSAWGGGGGESRRAVK